MSDSNPATPERLFEEMWAPLGTQALAAAVELGMFQCVAKKTRTAADVAKASRCSLRGTRLLLDALVAKGYLAKKAGRYSLEAVARRFLLAGQPGFIGELLTLELLQGGGQPLTQAVKSGAPSIAVDQEEAGREFFPRLVSALFPPSFGAALDVVRALPAKTKAGIHKILDVAAGSAAWSIPFAQAIPGARVTIVDYPEVTPVARRFTGSFGVSDRYDYVEGNLRATDFGRGGYDLVILGHIIHSEGAKWGRKLIDKSYKALAPGGMLLIAEMIPNDSRTGPIVPALFGLNMLLHTTEGDVFTMKEYRSWLRGAGFKRVKLIPVAGPSPIILATK